MTYSSKQNISREEALSRAMRYCAYQERSTGDVVRKLNDWGLDDDEAIFWVIDNLKNEKFVDDQRFARIYANSKLNQNQWGKNKIKYALREKSVPDGYIKHAIEQIPDDKYHEVLQKLANEKAKKTGLKTREQRAKLTRFLLQRGFSQEEINKAIHELIKDI
ncbi:MAG: RecX family transcriptional regulator [Bacteroidales bacterium]|nr:RecX family transcriptional regulator [Bacteroidales bacterium]MCF8326682.1 RecX family transcriptional regulator [Bacteroidales bacterium]